MQISLPYTEQDYVNLMLQRTDFIVKSGYSGAISHWTQTGSTDGFKELIANQSFLKPFLANTFDACQSEAVTLAEAIKKNTCPYQSFLSIGCGNALVELFVAQILQPSIIFLVDIEQTPGKHYHGVSNSGSGYSSLASAVKFLESNLGYSPVIATVNPLRQKLPAIKVDLAISLLSAGFHYSMNEYREFLLLSLTHGGTLVFDERKQVPDTFKFRRDGFIEIAPCAEGVKHERCMLVRS